MKGVEKSSHTANAQTEQAIAGSKETAQPSQNRVAYFVRRSGFKAETRSLAREG